MRNNYTKAAEHLLAAIDIALETLHKFRPEYNHGSTALIQDRDLILNAAPEYQNVRSLKYLEESFFTYYNEAVGPDVDYFWERIHSSGLPYKRDDKLQKILLRGKIKSENEYALVTDMLVIGQQEGRIHTSDAFTLSKMLGEFESRRSKSR